jgi:hypothetical protein
MQRSRVFEASAALNESSQIEASAVQLASLDFVDSDEFSQSRTHKSTARMSMPSPSVVSIDPIVPSTLEAVPSTPESQATGTPEETQEPTPGGQGSKEDIETDEDEGSSTALLVVVVVLMILLCALFAYGMYKEKEKKDKGREKDDSREKEKDKPLPRSATSSPPFDTPAASPQSPPSPTPAADSAGLPSLSSLLPPPPDAITLTEGELLMQGMALLIQTQRDLVAHVQTQTEELRDIRRTILKFAKLVKDLHDT